jgi:ubiquitin carboxyl-terminal hydrolase 25/28
MYYTYLMNLVTTLQAAGSCPSQLQELLVIEQSRQRFTFSDVQTAARDLGFGLEGDLRVEYDEEIEDEFVENAWRDLVKRSWKDLENGATTQRNANEALRILAQVRSSERLMKTWEAGQNKMNPEQAYNTLEVPKETDDAMLITVFSMRVSCVDISSFEGPR